MLPTERLAYSAIADRPPLRLPDGARLAVWVIVNVEEWDIRQTMPRTVLTPPAGGSPMPDIPNWAWHEYGNRVGFWRMLEVFDDFRIPAALAINGSAIAAYEPIARAARDRGWEFMGHGFTQRNMQKVENEAADIARTTEAIAAFTGRRPRGWLGPGLTETWDTPDLLVEAGYDYVCDWVLDDQPVVLNTRSGPIVNVPYTQECNDVAMMLIQHHKASEYADRAIDQFEQLTTMRAPRPASWPSSSTPTSWARRTASSISARPSSTSPASDAVLFRTGEQILDWYNAERVPPRWISPCALEQGRAQWAQP